MGLNIPGLLKSTGSWLMAAAMMLSACTTELASDSRTTANGKQEELVTLKLLVPGAADAGKKGFTRTLDEETEKKIEDLYILAFKQEETGSETFQYFTKARSSEGNTQWETSLHVETYQQTFVVIANADGTAGDKEISLAEKIISLEQGTGKDEILKRLTVELTQNEKTSGFNAESDHDHRPFTMYGQTKATITGKTGIELKVSLHRIMGRIQLYFGKDGDGLEDFTPEAVYLYNFNDRASVLPENLEDTGTDYVQSPTIPEGFSRIKGPVEYEIEPSANKLERSIYLFETQQPEATGVSAHTERTCLVVKGKYQDKESSYYRVDLAKPDENGGTELDYLDVLRNHSYNITVTSVSGQGHGTEEEAFQAKAANITANIVVWNDTEIGNVDFDGENFLGIGTMEYRVGKIKATHVQKVKASKGLEWSVKVLAVDESGKVSDNDPGWIKFGGQSTASGTGTGKVEDLNFTVDEYTPATGERKAVMRFSARNLKVDVMVIQDTSNPVFINVDESDIEFDINGETKTREITFGPEGVKLEWTISSANQPIDFSTATNGTQSTGTNVPIGTCNWTASANAIQEVEDSDYVTKTATLVLVATNIETGEVVSKAIRMSQKKYGVSIDRNSITCSGNVAKIRVKGNMDWKVELTEDQGAVYEGWIKDFSQNQTGYASENYTTTNDNVTIIQTEKRSDFDSESKELTLKFTDRNDNRITCIKTVSVRKGLIINGVTHEVLGPIEISVLDAFWNNIANISGYKNAKFANENTAKLITKELRGACWIENTMFTVVAGSRKSENTYYPYIVRDEYTGVQNEYVFLIPWKYEFMENGYLSERTYSSNITLKNLNARYQMTMICADMTRVSNVVTHGGFGMMVRSESVGTSTSFNTVRPSAYGGDKNSIFWGTDVRSASVYPNSGDLALIYHTHLGLLRTNKPLSGDWTTFRSPFDGFKDASMGGVLGWTELLDHVYISVNNNYEDHKIQTYYINPIE